MSDLSPTFPQPLQPHEKLFFIHIPKTAGSTFRAILASCFDRDTIYPVPVPFQHIAPDQAPPFPTQYSATYKEAHSKFVTEDITPYRLIMGHWDFRAVEHYPHAVAITFLRDPIQRLISTYRFLQRKHEESWNKVGHEVKDMSLSEWATHPQMRKIFRNWQTRQMAGVLHTAHPPPLSEEALLKKAKSNLARCRFIGMAERFDDSLLLFAATFGCQPITAYQSYNEAPTKTEALQVDSQTFDDLMEMAQLDVQLYEYAKQLYNQRLSNMIRSMFGIHTVSMIDADREYTYQEIAPKHLLHSRVRKVFAWQLRRVNAGKATL